MARNLLRSDEPPAMNPYLGGALAGLLLVASVWVAGKYFGASTSMVSTAGMLEELVAPMHVGANEYFQSKGVSFDWQWMFVFGIFLGSLASSLAEGSFLLTHTPSSWRERFGPAPGKRAVAAFLGGVLAILGARLAGGCPSGHGLSGSIQLAVSGFVAMACFFAGGLAMARLVYKGK